MMLLLLFSDLSALHSPSHLCIHLCFLQDGLTPVMVAYANGHSELVKILIDQYGCVVDDPQKVSARC